MKLSRIYNYLILIIKLPVLTFITLMAISSKSTSKPTSILELEQIYQIHFELSELRNTSKLGGIHDTSYSVDKNGNVNGIAMVEVGIKDLSPLKKFDLIYLNLTRNKIENIEAICSQAKLKFLYLGGNRIVDIAGLSKLLKLEILVIWDSPVTDFNTLCNSKLKRLYAQSTGISDLSFIKQIPNLEDLVIENNRINNLDVLLEVPVIRNLELSYNDLRVIPYEVAEKYNWFRRTPLSTKVEADFIGRIVLDDNPLYFPPASVVELGSETVEKYYQAATQFGHAPLSEGRIIVVGDGSAGKSSLVERILYDRFEQGKEQTNGIKIDTLNIFNDDRNLTFHMWDFGGQEIQHAVHKFFFTEGCLYLLVLDNRKEEEPEYWLQQIESLGGGAPVIVIFNKQDDNIVEIADRKFLKEKYPNIVSFHNISCKTGNGISFLKDDIVLHAINLRTVDEQFPNNWFEIKKIIEGYTSSSHYLDYNKYNEICRDKHVDDEKSQKLLLKYFTTIGAITWFGDTFLNFLHVLSPAWITQGVYKIITSKKTDRLAGKIDIADFEELLNPLDERDYKYDHGHYGYILTMMRKFDLCYSPDDNMILIPSAFGKVPKVEYSDFRGPGTRTYILQFKEYMPIALIHRFIAKNLPSAFENNFWYTGIVIADIKKGLLAMIHADREAKRIYIRIKGDTPLGIWEHTRREFADIISSYAKVPYDELILLDVKTDSTVAYEDIVSFLEEEKHVYFHPKLKKDFNVGYLLGFFQTQQETINKIEGGQIGFRDDIGFGKQNMPNIALQIINNINPNIVTQVNTNLSFNIEIVNNISAELKGEANYLLDEIDKREVELFNALNKIVTFSNEAKKAENADIIREAGWGRKLKNVIPSLLKFSEQIKKVNEGSETLSSLMHKLQALSTHFKLDDLKNFIDTIM